MTGRAATTMGTLRTKTAALGLALALAGTGRAADLGPGEAPAAPVAAAGSIGAGLPPDAGRAPWRLALASGVAARFEGYQVDPDRRNATVLLAFGGQADGAWTDGYGRAARLRLRLLTGGERHLFLPSDGEVEAAFALGRPELRFVLGRAEVTRAPGLAIQALVQVATLPSFEGTLPLADGQGRLFYALSPVELAWVWYYDRAHLTHSAGWPTETDRPDAASAVRARASFELPPAVQLSVEGELLKFWAVADRLVALEGSAGVAVLDRTVLLAASLRWERFTRRGTTPGSHPSDGQVVGQAGVTMVF